MGEDRRRGSIALGSSVDDIWFSRDVVVGLCGEWGRACGVRKQWSELFPDLMGVWHVYPDMHHRLREHPPAYPRPLCVWTPPPPRLASYTPPPDLRSHPEHNAHTAPRRNTIFGAALPHPHPSRRPRLRLADAPRCLGE
jgi:hypothetical protein